jgi:hypothetical protein
VAEACPRRSREERGTGRGASRARAKLTVRTTASPISRMGTWLPHVRKSVLRRWNASKRVMLASSPSPPPRTSRRRCRVQAFPKVWTASSTTWRSPARERRLVEPTRAPDLAPRRERSLELDSALRPRIRAPARLPYRAQDAVDAEAGVPETGVSQRQSSSVGETDGEAPFVSVSLLGPVISARSSSRSAIVRAVGDPGSIHVGPPFGRIVRSARSRSCRAIAISSPVSTSFATSSRTSCCAERISPSMMSTACYGRSPTRTSFWRLLSPAGCGWPL